MYHGEYEYIFSHMDIFISLSLCMAYKIPMDDICSPHGHSSKDERGLSITICTNFQGMDLVFLRTLAPTKSQGMVCVLPISILQGMNVIFLVLYTSISKG
jgi:hypothetical protein